MSKFVRVGLKCGGEKESLEIILLETGKAPLCISLSHKEAGDLYSQLGMILPEEFLNVKFGESDQIDEEAKNEKSRY